MAVEPTLPSESITSEPDGPPKTNDEHVVLTGSTSIRSMAVGGLTQVSDTPLPLRTQIDPAILSTWDQPQPQENPRRPPPFVMEGPASPPFPDGHIPQISPSVTLKGVEAHGRTGEFSIEAASGTMSVQGVGASLAQATGITSEGSDTAELRRVVDQRRAAERFELVDARVLALEEVVRQIRQIPIGPGHNRGPSDFEPVSSQDMAGIDRIIRTWREQKVTAVINREELLESANDASRIADKLKEYLDDFLKAAAKSGGEQVGKLLFQIPILYGLYSTLKLVVEAVNSWLLF